MFFDIILLNTQHGGRFGLAWVAGTRGVRYVTKRKIKEFNVLKVCDELQLFIATNSVSPQKRFSLRLSAILINGSIKIFKEQVSILQEEVLSFTSSIHIPSGIRFVADTSDTTDTGIFQSPPTPVVKTKRKRTHKVVTETPENVQRIDEMFRQLQLPNIDDIFQPTARADEISIREEIPRRTEETEEEFGLGIRPAQEVEEEMQALFAKPQEIPIIHIQYPSSDVPQPLQNVIQVDAQVHAPIDGHGENLQIMEGPRRRTRERHSGIESISVQIEPEAGQITESISVMEPGPIIQPVPTEGPSLEKEAHPRTELPEVIQTVDIDVPREGAKEKRITRARKPLVELQEDNVTLRSRRLTSKEEKLLVKNPRSKFILINRCNEFKGQFVCDLCPLPTAPRRAVLEHSLYNIFWNEQDSENMQIRGGSYSRSLSLTKKTIDLRKTSTLSTQPSTSGSVSDIGLRPSFQPIETPEQGFGLAESTRQREDTVKPATFQEPVVPPSTPRKRKRTDDDKPERGIVQPIQIPLDDLIVAVPEEIRHPDQATVSEHIAVASQAAAPEVIVSQEIETTVHEQLPLEPISHVKEYTVADAPIDFKMRQQRIIDIVAAWTPDMGILSIEDVCEKPINRLNVAKGFFDVLTLAANRFLILKSEEDSIELKSIEKGPKFN